MQTQWTLASYILKYDHSLGARRTRLRNPCEGLMYSNRISKVITVAQFGF